MSLYSKRGVSAQKQEVHTAIRNLSKGLYPNAFCKIFPDLLGGDDEFVNIMHADGAGTKTVLAYLYWKETGDISIWKSVAEDAVVMNLDDMLCTGVYDNFLYSSTIDRNKILITGDVLEAIIQGTQDFFNSLKTYGIHIHYLGGETADVGDVVRTIAINGTMMARQQKSRIITNDAIHAGNVIVGLSSFGKATYETEYNSGIASNGLTSARHDVLHKDYATKYTESYESKLDDSVVYIGKHTLSEKVNVDYQNEQYDTSIGKLLLSSTRTYGPVMKAIFHELFHKIDGAIHCSGGGQTKCLKYLPSNLRIIKNNLFAPPKIFNIIQENSGADAREMYQVFNMGHRMELFTDEKNAEKIITIAKSFNVDGQIIGRVEASDRKELFLHVKDGILHYTA